MKFIKINYNKLLLVFVIFLLTLYLFQRFYILEEPFVPDGYNATLQYVNKGDEPWDRHPLYGSLPLNHNIKYDRTFYYELDNEAYQIALNKTFDITKNYEKFKDLTPICDAPYSEKSEEASQTTNETTNERINVAINEDLWDGPYNPVDADPSWKKGYDTFYKTFLDKLNESSYFCLPGETKQKTNIQIVHDRWRRFYIDKNNTNRIKIQVEVVLYRESKYQGKHIWVESILEIIRPGVIKVDIIEARVVGIIPEDQIALFPVIPIDKYQPDEYAFYDNDSYGFSSNILISDEDIVKELNRRRANLESYMRASYAVGQRPTSFETNLDQSLGSIK